MKTCRNIVAFLFLSLVTTFITSCETSDTNEETTELEFQGGDEELDKGDIHRPGDE